MTPESPIKIIDGKPFIYAFEKWYVTNSLKKEITDTEKLISDSRKAAEEEKDKAPFMAEKFLAAAKLLERTFLHDLKIVLERFENMEVVK